MPPNRLDDRVTADRAQGTGARYWYFPAGDLPWPDQHGPFARYTTMGWSAADVC